METESFFSYIKICNTFFMVLRYRGASYLVEYGFTCLPFASVLKKCGTGNAQAGRNVHMYNLLQENFNGSNTDGSVITAVSN